MAFALPYRIAFMIFDILLPTFGIYNNIANPTDVLAMYTRNPTAPVSIETRFLLDSGAGWYAMLLFTTVYLFLKKPDDVISWTALQGGVLMTDVFMLFAFYREMDTTGRLLATGSWSGQDWGNVVGYSFIALVRISFVSGVGLGGAGKGKESSKPKNA